MSSSVTVPSTIQIRPSRLTGLVVAVAILSGVTTWSVSQVTTESHTGGGPKSEAVSATKAYVEGVTALTPEQRAAVFGNVDAIRTQRRLEAEAKLGINLDDFGDAEQTFLIGLAAAGWM